MTGRNDLLQDVFGPDVPLSDTWRLAGLLQERQPFHTPCGLMGVAGNEVAVPHNRFVCAGLLNEGGEEYFRASVPSYVVWGRARGRRYTLAWYGWAMPGWHSARLAGDAPLEVVRQQWLVRALTHSSLPVEEVVDGRK